MFEQLPITLSALGVTGQAWAVALSGGPDSMALLHQLRALNPNIIAYIVDHGLRAESAAEAELVQARARELGITAHILRWQGAKPQTGIQAAARAARYALLVEACEAAGISHLFLGHHYNDQLETVALRAARSSGWRGLAGMPLRSQLGEVTLVRPLLAMPKAALLQYCAEYKLPIVTDPSNSNPRFARSALREQDLSQYATQQQLSAQRRQREQAAWLEQAEQSYEVDTQAGYARVLREVFTQPALLGALLNLIGQQGYGATAQQLEQACAQLHKGRSLTLAGCRLMMNGQGALLVREPANISCGWVAGRWDSRWKLSAQGEVVPLGQLAWRKSAQAPWLEALPGGARASLPYIKEVGVLKASWQPYLQPLRQIFAINSAASDLSVNG